MSSMKTWIKLCAVMSTLGASSPAADKTLIDYFLPTPIRGQLTTDVWGAPNVLPRDPQNGLEDSTMKQWCYWDGQIVKGPDGKYRSEEHTSELQSLRHLVCRLLLEKKKTKSSNYTHNRIAPPPIVTRLTSTSA